MKKFLRKFLIWTGIVLLALLLLLVLGAALFEKQIGKEILKQVNNTLTTELIVEEFNLSLLSGFPNASAELKGVTLAGSLDDELLKAEEVAFRFGLFSLFGDEIKARSIIIKNGRLIIVQSNRSGKSNYDIVKMPEEQPEAAEQENTLSLSLEKAILENVELGYVDLPANQEVRVVVKSGELSGDFSNTVFTLRSQAELFSKFVKLDGERYAGNKNLGYDADIRIDLDKGQYEMKDVQLQVEDTRFQVQGYVQQKGQALDMDLAVDAKEGSLNSITALLPPDFFKNLQGLDSRGNFFTKATIKGQYSDREMPAIQASFGLSKGRITTDLLREPFRDVTFTARYDNGQERNLRTTRFEIQDFQGYFNRELLELQLTVENLTYPTVDLQLNGALPMEALSGFLDNNKITGASGEIEFQDIEIKGRYKDMLSTARTEGVRTRGTVEFDDARLSINKKDLTLDRGRIQFAGNDYKVEDLHFEGPGTDIEFEGQCKNLLPVLLADSLNSKNAELIFSGKLHARSIDFDQMMEIYAIPFEEGEASQQVIDSLKEVKVEKRERVTDFLDGTFEATVESFKYRKMEGEDFQGKLTFKNNELDVEGETMIMGGHFRIEGEGFFEKRPKMKMHVYTEDVDVKEFFRQNENFWQDYLTDENLSGELESKIFIEAYWDEQGEFLMDDLHVLADVRINEGELRDFEMLYSYKPFIKMKELKRIRFTALQNWLEIENGTIFIPVMFIQSSAVNLTLSGEHTFDQEIDYYFKINAGQVLAERLKGDEGALELVPTKRRGFFNLYAHVFGTVEDYDYNTKARVVRAHFEETDRQKDRIKQKLIAEFGPIINLDEPVSWKDDIPEYEEEGDPEDPEYLEGF